jgi:CheY-like chemotaxis protein
MRSLNLLLADDDPDDCLIFSHAIEQMPGKIKFTCLSSCHRLMHFLNDDNVAAPDVIFLDLNMPGINGRDCLTKMKTKPGWEHIPIVIYSTASREEIIEECYRLGAKFFIVKPDQPEKLKAKISWVIEKFTSAENQRSPL